MRRLLVPLAALVLLLAAAATASAHTSLVATSPPADARLATAPAEVVLHYNEPVELPREDAVDVVDATGGSAASGPAAKDGSSTVRVPLRPGLREGTYTVRWSIVGADSHVVSSVFVFGVGPGPLGPPYLAGAGGGPSETGPWGTSSRFLEIAGLGGLVGLIAFRWIVWGPVMRRRAARDTRDAAEAEVVLAWGRDAFWVGFGVLAVGAMLAEGYLLVVQSASVLGVDVPSALRDAAGISDVLGGTRFGSLVQLRGALLFGLFAIGAVLFVREYGSTAAPRAAEPSGPPWSAWVMGGLLLAVLGGIADQGHAGVTGWVPFEVGTQLVHIVAVAVWVTGLLMIALVHLRLPRIAPGGGPALASAVLARFSRVALIAVAAAVATGVLRSIAELDDPAELWETAYGRSILIKVGLLLPVAALALYNRKVIVALRRVRRPNAPTLRRVRRLAEAELALSLVIVVVASVLVAQVPGAG